MALKFDKVTEDKRGKILWITDGDTEIHVAEIKKGFARGGHFHKFDSIHIVTSGKVAYKETNLKDDKESIELLILFPLSLLLQTLTPHNGF